KLVSEPENLQVRPRCCASPQPLCDTLDRPSGVPETWSRTANVRLRTPQYSFRLLHIAFRLFTRHSQIHGSQLAQRPMHANLDRSHFDLEHCGDRLVLYFFVTRENQDFAFVLR